MYYYLFLLLPVCLSLPLQSEIGAVQSFAVNNGELVTENQKFCGVDVVQDKGFNQGQREKRNPMLLQNQPKWINGEIPYEFINIADEKIKTYTLDAIETLKKNTCIRWVPKTSKHTTWVQIVQNDNMNPCGNAGHVGMPQVQGPIKLSMKCVDEVVVKHEMMHVIGFDHEQDRMDQINYFDAFYENMQTDRESGKAFTSSMWDTYEYTSIMHYPLEMYQFVSKYRFPWLPKDRCIRVGAGKDYTETDLRKINIKYNCTELIYLSAVFGKGPPIPEKLTAKDYDLNRIWAEQATLYQCFMEGDKAVPKATGCLIDKDSKTYKNGEFFTLGGKQVRCDISDDQKTSKITTLDGCENLNSTEWILGRFAYNYECIADEKTIVRKIVGCTKPFFHARVVEATGVVRKGELIPNSKELKFKRKHYCGINAKGTKSRIIYDGMPVEDLNGNTKWLPLDEINLDNIRK